MSSKEQTTEDRLRENVRSIADTLSSYEKAKSEHVEGGRDAEDFSAFAYLEDALDIQYIVSGKGNDDCLGARILVAFGGPNIWINTHTKTVEGYWWNDEAHERYSDEIGLDDAIDELWRMKG